MSDSPTYRSPIGPTGMAIAAFGAYFCTYGFRKPFTAGTFDDPVAGKVTLVTAQVLGYMCSKFLGIKFISETPADRRPRRILGLIAFAQVALLLFAIAPPGLRAACLFLNGLPLGMVFGLVLGSLEGRQRSELLAAGLCASFIVADGVTKSVGGWLLAAGVSETTMPFVAGLVFAVPLLGFVGLLARVPPPSEEDRVSRSERFTMDRSQRGAFFSRYAVGLSLLIVAYVLVTVLRSIRADFAPEIWRGLGVASPSGVYTWSELLVAAAVILANGATAFIPDHRRAFFASLLLSAGGFVVVIGSVVARQAGWLNGFAFMTLVGVGLYFPYIAVHTTVFERLIAITRDRGTVLFLMSVADAAGYCGYVAVMLGQSLIRRDGPFVDSFMPLCLIVSGLGVVLMLATHLWFARHPSFRESIA